VTNGVAHCNTYCNTLQHKQHAATDDKQLTLQNSATHCNTLHHIAPRCNKHKTLQQTQNAASGGKNVIEEM